MVKVRVRERGRASSQGRGIRGDEEEGEPARSELVSGEGQEGWGIGVGYMLPAKAEHCGAESLNAVARHPLSSQHTSRCC